MNVTLTIYRPRMSGITFRVSDTHSFLFGLLHTTLLYGVIVSTMAGEMSGKPYEEIASPEGKRAIIELVVDHMITRFGVNSPARADV